MNADAIARMERTFDCTLHDDYKRLLFGFPKSLTKLLSIEPDRQCRKIFTDASTIIAVNKHIRRPDLREDPSFFDFQGKYFVIGSDVGGNFYCINCKLRKSTVTLWFHEDGVFESYARSINDFVLKVFQSAGDVAVDELKFVSLS